MVINLRTRLSLSVVSLVAAVVLATGTMTVISERQHLKAEVDRHHARLIKQLARVCEESLYQDEIVLFNYFKGLESERGFLSACFLDKNGRVRLHSNPKMIGAQLTSPAESSINATTDLFSQTYRLENGMEVVDLAAPVFFGGKRAGTARALFSKSEIESQISESLRATIRRVAFVSLISLAAGLFGAVALASTLAAPVRQTVLGMKAVAEGRLTPFPVPKRRDELGLMVQELNLMISKLKAVDEMKQELTASVTHELRSPLTAIQSFIGLILKDAYGPLTARQRESLLIIQNNAARLEGFVDNVLTAAKLDSKQLEIFLEIADVRKSAREVFDLYRLLGNEKGIDFSLALPPEPVLARIDHEKLVQALSNLVSNAFKFTEKGSVVISAAVHDTFVHLAVADTGAGIPADERAAVFEKFYRLRATARQAKGTGLGLAIAKGFVELQGGTISVEENPGGGSVFRIRFSKADPHV